MSTPDPSQQTPASRRTVLVFLFGLVAAALFAAGAFISWDIYLYSTAPDGVNTISWSMALAGYNQPIVAFGFGLMVGVGFMFFVALAVHFWFGVGSVVEWADYQHALLTIALLTTTSTAKDTEIAQLKAQLAAKPTPMSHDAFMDLKRRMYEASDPDFIEWRD